MDEGRSHADWGLERWSGRTCIKLGGYRSWKWRDDTHAGRDVPLSLAVVKDHDFVGADARLALAGA